jgi:hypothetical protein
MDIQNVLENEYVVIGLALFIGLYGLALARIPLPNYIRNLFNNNLFRVFFLSLLLINNFERAPHIAVIVALVFVLTLEYLSNVEQEENMYYAMNM